jgi:hypothetical protein
MWMHGRLISITIAIIAVGALLGVPRVAAHPDRPGDVACPAVAGPARAVAAKDLAKPVPLADCGLSDATITAGALAVEVPDRDGEWVTAAGTSRGAHPATLTVARADGEVRARVWLPGGDPVPPSDGVERLGRAEGQPPLEPSQEGGPAAPGVNTPPVAPATPEATPNRSARCVDAAGTWLGMRWDTTYRWWLRTSGIPDYLGAVGPVRETIRGAASWIDDGRNDCGLSGGLGLSQRYAGESDRDADIRPNGSCGRRDEHNAVAFGELNGGLLALTCLWWSRGRTVEADVRISDSPGMFTLNPASDCVNQWDLQGTVTHEFGHVFGLGHVAYAQHGDLTMSDGLPACSSRFRALGLGDLQTLRAQYGTD